MLKPAAGQLFPPTAGEKQRRSTAAGPVGEVLPALNQSSGNVMPSLFRRCFDEDQCSPWLQYMKQASEACPKIFCGMQRVRNQHHIVTPFVNIGRPFTVQIE